MPNLSSDPNDCYFEDCSLENIKNKETEGKFYHMIDLRFKLNLNVDNRFAWDAPTVTKVSPYKAHVRGGDILSIFGYNFGDFADNVAEVRVKNVLCINPKVVNKNLISCSSGVNVFDNGVGNVVVKLRNGLSSPNKTCPMFEYFGVIPKKVEKPDAVNPGSKRNCTYSSPKIVSSISNLK